MDLARAIDEAVANAELGDDVEYATPATALGWLLELSWNDLADAQRRARNGVWSIECEDYVSRIAGITRLIGPLPWGKVQVRLILDGTYEYLHAKLGFPTPLSAADRARVRDTYRPVRH
jgi:hypothetical protein